MAQARFTVGWGDYNAVRSAMGWGPGSEEHRLRAVREGLTEEVNLKAGG